MQVLRHKLVRWGPLILCVGIVLSLSIWLRNNALLKAVRHELGVRKLDTLMTIGELESQLGKGKREQYIFYWPSKGLLVYADPYMFGQRNRSNYQDLQVTCILVPLKHEIPAPFLEGRDASEISKLQSQKIVFDTILHPSINKMPLHGGAEMVLRKSFLFQKQIDSDTALFSNWLFPRIPDVRWFRGRWVETCAASPLIDYD